VSIQQANAQLLFQAGNGVAERGLRQPQALRGPREVAGFGNRQKGLHLVDGCCHDIFRWIYR